MWRRYLCILVRTTYQPPLGVWNTSITMYQLGEFLLCISINLCRVPWVLYTSSGHPRLVDNDYGVKQFYKHIVIALFCIKYSEQKITTLLSTRRCGIFISILSITVCLNLYDTLCSLKRIYHHFDKVFVTHWLHKMLSKWQHSVQPMTTISSKSQHFRVCDVVLYIAVAIVSVHSEFIW